MKILHINSYYSSSKFYKNLFDHQLADGLNIDVFVPVSSNFEHNDFDYGNYTSVSRNHNRCERYLFHLKHHKIHMDVLDRYNIEDYSVIHAHSLFSNGYIAYRLKKEFGIPYIVAVRNTDVNLFFKRMIHLRKLGVEILHEADQIIFLSESYKDQTIGKYIPIHLKKLINNKSTIIPNGIDDFWFSRIGFPKKKPEVHNLRLLQIGDINKNKNILTTVKAVDILCQNGYNVKLDVVGRVKDQNVFNNIKNLDYVNYLGYKSKGELINIYKENDIFILPSINETFGLVYAEAMSQGLPILYSRGQGFDKQFEDGEVGYSVDCFNENEVMKKIVDIIDRFEDISNNSITACKKFQWDNISHKYSNIYENLNNLKYTKSDVSQQILLEKFKT